MVLSEEIAFAVYEGDIRGVEAALATGDDINDTYIGMDSVTLLRLARISSTMPNEDARTRMIQFLLENGADPHKGDQFAEALYVDSADVVRLFVEHGANVNARDRRGRLPLSRAMHNAEHSLEVCRVLLQFGARPTADYHDILLDGIAGTTLVDHAICVARDEARAQPVADLLVAVRDAGSWHRYCVEPSVKLLALRHLSLAGRAVAPPNLLRLFGAPPRATGCASRTRSKRRLGSSVDAPPTDVFRLILEFWGGNRS